MSDSTAFLGTVAQVSASVFAIVAVLFTERLAEHRRDIEPKHDDVERQIGRVRALVAQCAAFTYGKRDTDRLLAQRVEERLGGGQRPFDLAWADAIRAEASDALPGVMDGKVRHVLEQIVAGVDGAARAAARIQEGARPLGLQALVWLIGFFGFALAMSLGQQLPRELTPALCLLIATFTAGLVGFFGYVGWVFYRLHRLGRFDWPATPPKE